jgi:uncharacterized phage-associated protein
MEGLAMKKYPEYAPDVHSDVKLAELSLYIAKKSLDDPSFGATKLNKILFVSDFYQYGIKGKAVTGTEYTHQTNGPVPKRMPAVLNALVTEGKADIAEVNYFGYTQKRLIPLADADTALFDAEQLSFVNSVIEQFRPWTGKQLSAWTHTLRPWLLSGDGETIPYFTVFSLTRKTVEQAGIEWAKSEIRRIKGEA